MPKTTATDANERTCPRTDGTSSTRTCSPQCERSKTPAEALPRASMPPQQRLAKRADWFERAQRAVADSELVFLDPDNGLAVPSVPLTSPMSGKYATVHEIVTLLDTGAGVVLYQHGNRTPWVQQRQQVCD